MNEARIAKLSEDIIEALKGQCLRTIDSELEAIGLDMGSAPPALLRAIDDGVFCCECCGWYCSTDEMSEIDMVCDECDERD